MFLLGMLMAMPVSVRAAVSHQEVLFDQMVRCIEEHYVNEKGHGVKLDVRQRPSVESLVRQMDPMDRLLYPETDKKYKKFKPSASVGLRLRQDQKNLKVVTPLLYSHASWAGILPGDKVLSINGQSCENMSLMTAVKSMRGDAGSALKLVVQTAKKNPRTVEIKRQFAEPDPVIGSAIDKDGIVYLRLTEFIFETSVEVRKFVAYADKKGVKGLILDLRNNPGGLLTEAIDTAGCFLPKGTLVGFAKRGKLKQPQSYFTSEEGFKKFPIVVLINGGTSAEAEILAAGLKEAGRVVLMGNRSQGLCPIQSNFQLVDGYALRITTAHFYTPKGRLLQNAGIKPDIQATGGKNLYLESSARNKALSGYLKDPLILQAYNYLKSKLKTN